MPKVISVHQTAGFITEYPFRDIRPAIGRGFKLALDAKVSQRLTQFSGHIDAANLSTFWGSHFAMGVVSLDQQEAALKVEIAPLEGEEFTESESSTDRAEE
ncbi:MAG: hypothetical protein CV090_09335 [Nitrospira sp. WS238]|nr:hypothetical protein [Nitrospira sp. WS238]